MKGIVPALLAFLAFVFYLVFFLAWVSDRELWLAWILENRLILIAAAVFTVSMALAGGVFFSGRCDVHD